MGRVSDYRDKREGKIHMRLTRRGQIVVALLLIAFLLVGSWVISLLTTRVTSAGVAQAAVSAKQAQCEPRRMAVGAAVIHQASGTVTVTTWCQTRAFPTGHRVIYSYQDN